MKKLYGITAAMLTPFTANNTVDLTIVRKMTDSLIERGVHCLYPNGTTGEMYLMSMSERKKVAETVVDQARGRVTVFIHTGAMRFDETIELSSHAYHIGADGIGVVTPSYFSVNDKELEKYYVDIANNLPANFPVYLYNIPQLSGNDLKPATVSRILEQCPNIAGIKYSYCDFLRVSEYIHMSNGTFSVVIGNDKLLLGGLSIGCDGLVSGVACVCPEIFVSLYDAYSENDMVKARILQKRISALCKLLKNGSRITYLKSALRFYGIDIGNMRRPFLNLTTEEYCLLEKNLSDFNIDSMNYQLKLATDEE